MGRRDTNPRQANTQRISGPLRLTSTDISAQLTNMDRFRHFADMFANYPLQKDLSLLDRSVSNGKLALAPFNPPVLAEL